MALFFASHDAAKGQDEAEDSPYQPGLVATYLVGDQSATRSDETIAFDWQDAACDPRLAAGEFTAQWRGRLWARGAGSYTLACYVQGDVTVTLAGRTVISGRAEQPKWLSSQPLELEFDYHPLQISFRRTQAKGQLALFWSGPDFRLEPVPERALMHEREKTPSIEFERGRQLAAALRCAACHMDTTSSVVPAPALDRLSGNVHEHWLVDWLGSHAGAEDSKSLRRMPDWGMTRQEAEAIAAWLLREPAKVELKKEQKVAKEETKRAESKSGKKSKGEEKPKPSAQEGERLILVRGCLACHKFGQFGESGLFGGGDLTALFDKRPVEFLNRWLQDPAAINRQHRMPVFTFTNDELTSLSLWGKDKAKSSEKADAKKRSSNDLVPEGEKLVGIFKCASCHAIGREGEAPAEPPRQTTLTGASDWSRSCTGEPRREKLQPGYRLVAEDQKALRAYYSVSRPSEGKLSPQARGRDLLVQLNCLACHQREGINRAASALPPLLQDKLVAVSETHAELAPLVPAMTPPALNSVGDKLHDAALTDAITRQGPPHRPYLLVQMPKFNLSSEQLAALTAYFVATDRIPSGAGFQPAKAGELPAPQPPPTVAALEAAGPRLVTTDGLSCTSCHQVGSVLPSKAPLNARGPDMSMLGKRIRREWFDRWCDNPARIVPRMEMPAVKIPVRGVLSDKIDDQLAAVWHILNTTGFQPPEPNPVRVLRLSGIPEKNERPIVIHDVVKDGDKTYLFPLVIGLPNRHNILFDLETNRLAAWWLGDTARQRTKGKSWWWDQGGKSIVDFGSDQSEISLVIDGKEHQPVSASQSPTASLWEFGRGTFNYTLLFKLPESATRRKLDSDSWTINVGHQITPTLGDKPLGLGPGFERGISIGQLPENTLVRFRPGGQPRESFDAGGHIAKLNGIGDAIAVFSDLANAHPNPDGSVDFTARVGSPSAHVMRSPSVAFRVRYATKLVADRYESPPILPRRVETVELYVAPGIVGRRLPLTEDLMPSALAWDYLGRLYFATLKGQVFAARDIDQDGSEDPESLLIDGLATPYGLSVRNIFGPQGPRGPHLSYIDVLTKTGVMRLEGTGVQLERIRKGEPTTGAYVAARGWGATDDYHDWAVGLVPGDDGEYYVALPCQQDQRSEAAAKYRGCLLKLLPKSLGIHEKYDIEVISSGHRFPMGMARNRDGELFVTDNQGNYNPFNELNHVKKGAHYGFINALEKQSGVKPLPLTPPAINIPHPWTRSVNGICFLDTPKELREKGKENIYGPLEGHLVGCEYDTRRLIRMSLQKIGDTYQGAAYPLSIPPADVEKGLLGPIVCAIKPTTGELYVGEIRDSGWGAGNNIGQIVKIKIEPDKLPCGIAEVRAMRTGFTIDFFRPVDRAKAADMASYSIQSYRRESTPAYGGPDLDRRTETIHAAEVSGDGKRVTLALPELRAGGHVYEIRVKNLAPGGQMFHPDEAHYTLNQIPD